MTNLDMLINAYGSMVLYRHAFKDPGELAKIDVLLSFMKHICLQASFDEMPEEEFKFLVGQISELHDIALRGLRHVNRNHPLLSQEFITQLEEVK